MGKSFLLGESALKSMQKGINTLADIVKTTLGPKGKNVILERKFASPLVTNDGVTIAKEVELEDPFENIGASLVKEVSIKTNELAGDGTTTATVLAQELINEGIKNIASGASPIIIKKGMNFAKQVATEKIKELSKPVCSSKEIEQIATISSGDEEIGKLIASAMEKVGSDGIISTEESRTSNTHLDITQGMQLDKGFISPYMATDTNKMCTELKNAYILITDKKISSSSEYIGIAEQLISQGASLLIIAEDVDGEALATLLLNKINGTFSSVCIKAPAFGENRKETLQDIAILTGGTYFSSDLNMDIKQATLTDLGRAETIKITANTTTIIGGLGDTQKIEARKQEIKTQIAQNTSDYNNQRLTERLAKFCGGVAVLYVGGNTEAEMHEKKLRIEDALSATKSATEEGIVCGGGTTFVRLIDEITNKCNTLTYDEQIGAKIVAKALEMPLRQIAKNANKDDGVIFNTVYKNKDENFGYDALNDTYTNMFSSGIIDPAKVTRCSLENAISIATMILVSNALIVDTSTPQA